MSFDVAAVAADDPTHAGARALLGGLLRTARPKQWAKNVLVLAAPAAGGVLTRVWDLEHALGAFAAFCLLASGTYFLNDVMDVAADRAHPTKRHRPIAAGVVPESLAWTAAIAVLLAAVVAGTLLEWRLGVVLEVYIGLQLAYSSYLKHQPVYDLVAVAGGFLLRAIAGAVAVNVPVSEWFLIVASFGSLLMVTGKRLGEQIELEGIEGNHRATLRVYTPTFLRVVLGISATGAIIGYSLWALSMPAVATHHHSAIWCELSIIPIFIALLKYAFLVEAGNGAKPEDLVLSDRSLLLLGALWTACFAAGIYAR